MTCEIKSGHHPVQIKCSFPEVNETKRDFSVYFHSSDGSQNAVANCIFNGRNKCLAKEGFNAALDGLNAATITVPDSFATKTGMFVCQKGDLPFIKNCQFPPVGNFVAGNSFKSEIDYGMTTNVLPTFVTPENSGNEDDNQWVIICAVVSAIVGMIFVIVCIITIIWFKRRKTKKHHEHSCMAAIKKKIHLFKRDHECKVSFLPNEGKSSELFQDESNADLN